ncbi:hypothetical protein [Halotalea alkalilenta]|uniref:hypothetical protein n=1 Tax=Halotalea alkalilenta TaxID=376489 RepID=UPI000694974B|nr:hypothetical protein [Halotalea alkalilenta]
MALTIQAHHHGRWHDAAQLMVDDPSRGRAGPARLEYDPLYACDWLGHDDLPACSLRLPVELILVHRSPHWFGFLDDIMPSGAGRRFWIAYLGLTNLEPHQQDYELLSRGTIAPVGNLRIAQAVPEQTSTQRFGLNEVVERDTDFLEYAQMHGAASGGATGAGGEAPKLLLRRDDHERIWIDARQDDDTCLDRHYLVKFPRGAHGTIAAELVDLVEPEHLLDELGRLARQLVGLRDRMETRGVPSSILDMPNVGLGNLDQRINTWRLP